MNRVYKTVWNKERGCSQVAAESSKNDGRGTKSVTTAQPKLLWEQIQRVVRLSILGLALLPVSILAAVHDLQLPTGGHITAGDAQIQQQHSDLNIYQQSQHLGLQWDHFNIGQQATVNFYQPDATAVVVNRVLDQNASQIMGQLNANGQVFLLNPNGVIFSETAQVNVGAMVASTLALNDDDIISGLFTLKNQGQAGKIQNAGQITAQGGSLAFIAPTVINKGQLHAENGVIHLTSADQVTLRLQDGRLTQYSVDIGTLQGLIDNQGAILANNGAVYLTAKAKDQLSSAIVNHSGVIEANRLSQNAKGEIVLLADLEVGTAHISGQLKAEGYHGQNGGFVETSAAKVHINDSTQVSTQSDQAKTGTWLIDPTDFTIHSGHAAASISGIGAKTLENNLNHTSVQLETQSSGTQAGDIRLNAAVTWNQDTTLTLKAHQDIYINADVSAQHQEGKVALIYGQNNQSDANYYLADGKKINLQAGQNFSTQKGTDVSQRIDYTVITELGAEGSYSGTDLQGINANLAGHYVLGTDIDASATAQWGMNDEGGFLPIGNEFDGAFTGYFDGLGHQVSQLKIERPYSFGVGLFGFIEDSSIRHVGVESGIIHGDSFVGGLVGQSNHSLIQNSFSQADVEGYATIGGLVGGNYESKIQDSFATGNVTGGDYSIYVGGLVGANDHAHIANSYATGEVQGDEIIGGLVGDNNNHAQIERSYATGNVTGLQHVGGLAGNSYYSSSIQDSYATGAVSGENVVAGLVGENLASSINTSYATGVVTAKQVAALTGGLVAQNTQGTINHSIWDKDTTGQTRSAGSHDSFGRTQAEMFDANNYSGFDFEQVWDNAEGQTTAYLKQHKGQNHVALKDDPLGQNYAVIQTIEQLQQINHDLDGDYLLANDIDASITQTWADDNGQGFNPLGDATQAFTGSFNGLGHEIAHLSIQRFNQDQVGLIGLNQGDIRDLGVIDAQISGQNQVGGVIGHNQGQASSIYSSGQVNGQSNVGGLIGHNQTALAAVYSQADVTGQSNIGGLIGLNAANIQDVYSRGDVTGEQRVGGLIGQNLANFQIDRVFSTGKITGTTSTGALVGDNAAAINDAYWHHEINPNMTAIGAGQGTAQGLSTAQLVQADRYAFLDQDSTLGGKDTTWRIYDGHTGPLLRHFLTTQDLSLGDKTTTYNGQEQFFAEVFNLDPSQYVAEGQVSGTDAGEYKATYYSNEQQGYDFIGHEGTLIIDKAVVTIQGSSETDKIYNGQQQVMQNPQYSVEGLVNGESEALLGTITVSGAAGIDAGTYLNKVQGEQTETKNYIISYENGEFIINKKQITITATDEIREYNGALQAITGFIAEGLVDGEDESVLTNINSLATRKDAGTYVHAVAFKNNQLGEKNYDVVKFQNATYTITKANATVKANDLTTVYNGENQTVAGFAVTGLKANEKVTVLGEMTNLAATGHEVGEYENQVTGAESVQNYNIVYEKGTLHITPKELIGSISAQDKVYDGTTQATLIGQLSGVITGDDLIFNTRGQFIDKHVGENKSVEVTASLSGADTGNYTLIIPQQQTTANINKAPLNVMGNSATVTQNGELHRIAGFTVDGLMGSDTQQDITGVVASGAEGIQAGTYTNQVSGSDNNYELKLTDGQLIIEPEVILPTDPIVPIEPLEPTDPIVPVEPLDPLDPIEPVEPPEPVDPIQPQALNTNEYQRVTQIIHSIPTHTLRKNKAIAEEIDIEIIGLGINIDGIQTLTGKFE